MPRRLAGRHRIYQNDFSAENHWVNLVFIREKGQACATGTRVRVVAGPLVQVLDVGGRNGYLSQNDLVLMIGLGNQTAGDSLYVRWTGGQRELFTDISPDPPYQIIWEDLGTPVTGAPDQGLPPAFRVRGNWPNPFNPLTHIVFALPARRQVELAVNDARGRCVTVLVDDVRAVGVHTVSWDGRVRQGKASASGVYFVRLRAVDEVARHKITLAK